MAKTINAVFTSGVFTRTAKVFQWDSGDRLAFVNVDLPNSYQVHFANSLTGASKTVLGDSTGAEIPPEYFVPGSEIYAWVWVSTENGGYTKYQVTIPIYKRAQPQNITPTPAQSDALDEAIYTLNAATEGIQNSINSALQEAKDSGEFDGPEGPAGPAGPVTLVDAIFDGYPSQILTETDPTVPSWAKAPNPPTEVYVATYNVDTADDIEAKFQAGKLCFAVYGDMIYSLTLRAENEILVPGGDPITQKVFEFTALDGTTSKKVTLTDSTWSHSSTDIAKKDSPTLTGTPKAPTAAAGTNTTQIATTAFVHDAVSGVSGSSVIPTGSLDNTSTATAMTATITGITALADGVCVWLTNGVIASASGVTLNINGLGAKPIYNSLTGALVTTTFTAASTFLFVYNSTRVTGGCWDMVNGYDTNTTYTPVKLGFGYTTCSTAEATAAKTAALSSYTLTTNGIVSVKFTNAVGANATLNINSKGAKAIYYQGSAITAGVIKAGDTATFIYNTYYHLISIDRQPTAADVGAIAAPSSPSVGDFLVYTANGWAAQSLSTWQGGNY